MDRPEQSERDTDADKVVHLEAAAKLRDKRLVDLVTEVEQLQIAMDSRSVIEQAKGVIMHTMNCGPDAAFAALVAQSQHQNRKLRDVAAELAGLQDHTPPLS